MPKLSSEKQPGRLALLSWLLALLLLGAVNSALGAKDDQPTSSVHPELDALCRELAPLLRSVPHSLCTGLGLKPSGSHSVEGRPILARSLLPGLQGDQLFHETSGLRPVQAPGRVLLIGGTHGDELSSISIVFRWLDRLLREPDHRLHWRIAPLVNPDGLMAHPARRTNTNGVDLNRNMPSRGWEDQAHLWWAKETERNPRRYPGPLALSEPESRWLFDEIESFQPDIIVSLHAPYNNVDFDGPPEGPKQLGSLHLKYLGTFPGSLGRYGAEHDLPIVTIELPSALQMPSVPEQNSIWKDLLDYLAFKSANQRARAQQLGTYLAGK